MGKNIVITEGGKGRSMTAKKLKTALQGGGSCLWVPSSERQRTTISIDENGVYAPEGCYGFSQVTVNARPEGEANSITGKGRDGNEYTYSKPGEGEGEELTITKVPSMIAVSKYPNTTKYGVGAYLSFDGIEVKAFDAKEEFMYMVPTEELIFPVTQAPWDPTTDPIIYGAASDMSLEVPNPFPFSDSIVVEYGGSDKFTIKPDGAKRITGIRYQNNKTVLRIEASDEDFIDSVGTRANSYIANDKTVYYQTRPHSFPYAIRSITPNADPSKIYTRVSTQAQIAWTMMYGDIKQISGGKAIPVQWKRPGDGKLLECYFFIDVVAGPSGTDG